MAYNDSGELPVSQSTYSLGGYTFELKVQTVHEPGEPDVVSVYAICRGPDGTRETQAVDYPASATVESWSVECNETEASVYVSTKSNDATLKSGAPSATNGIVYCEYTASSETRTFWPVNAERPILAGVISRPGWPVTPFLLDSKNDVRNNWGLYSDSYVVDGVTFYINHGAAWPSQTSFTGAFLGSFADNQTATETLARQYFDFDKEDGGKIVGRFAIDIREADTEDWDEPGDDGPPGTTLYVTVTGATAGSCTGTPADNEAVKGYGDGGDGGYGGGGGAGASTVIIYDFATSIADSVQQEAISRGPGTGGPGGKGGKGGDGCILIFY